MLPDLAPTRRFDPSKPLRYAESPLGRNPTQTDYSDYREAGGVKVPFRWTIARPGGRFTIQIQEMQQNVPLNPTRFEKPAVASTLEQKPPSK